VSVKHVRVALVTVTAIPGATAGCASARLAANAAGHAAAASAKMVQQRKSGMTRNAPELAGAIYRTCEPAR